MGPYPPTHGAVSAGAAGRAAGAGAAGASVAGAGASLMAGAADFAVASSPGEGAARAMSSGSCEKSSWSVVSIAGVYSAAAGWKIGYR